MPNDRDRDLLRLRVARETCDTPEGIDDLEVVEWIDPDWRDHFSDASDAFDFYAEFLA